MEVTLSGYGLAGANVRANQPGITVTMISATTTSIRLSLAFSDSVNAGPVMLTITDTLGRSSNVELQIAASLTGKRSGNSGVKVSSNRGGLDRRVPASSDRRSLELPVPPNQGHRPAGSLQTQKSTLVGGQR